MDIDKIIQGCKNNDRASQEALYKAYFSTMMLMCMRYISDRDTASAIVNDGFLKVFTRIDQYQNKGSFEGWVRRIVFRCLSDTVRKDANYLKFMVFEDYEVAHRSNILSKLYEEDILRLIDFIPRASAEVFILFAIHGYSHKEIAEKQGISIGTSKWHLSEARKRLKELILKTGNSINAG